jgi:hypothetical protein
MMSEVDQALIYAQSTSEVPLITPLRNYEDGFTMAADATTCTVKDAAPDGLATRHGARVMDQIFPEPEPGAAQPLS